MHMNECLVQYKYGVIIVVKMHLASCPFESIYTMYYVLCNFRMQQSSNAIVYATVYATVYKATVYNGNTLLCTMYYVL